MDEPCCLLFSYKVLNTIIETSVQFHDVKVKIPKAIRMNQIEDLHKGAHNIHYMDVDKQKDRSLSCFVWEIA